MESRFNPGKSGFRVCSELLSDKLLLGGDAGNVCDQINDRITHFVLDIE